MNPDADNNSDQPEDPFEQQVVEYLLQHPGLPARHPKVLAAIEIPHESGAAVSLIERQVKTLREQAGTYRGQLESLIGVARENDSLNRRLHRLTLALMEARDLDETLTTLQDELREQFRADAVELKLFSNDELAQAIREGGNGPAMFQDFLDQAKPSCGRLQEHQLQYLFGDVADETGSAALIPIHGVNVSGVLAIGSRDTNRFHPGKGTDFLTRLGELVSKALQVVISPGV